MFMLKFAEVKTNVAMCCIHYRYLDQQEAAWKSITPIKSSVTTDCYGMTWKLQVCDINSLQRAASLGFYFHILQLGSFTFFWQIGVIEGLLRTNTFLQAFISQSVHLPSENYDPPLTSISSRQWEEFFAKASCACYKIAGSCKNCDKLEFMFREKNPYIMLLLGRPPTKRLWAEKINRKSFNDAPLVRLVIVLIAW